MKLRIRGDSIRLRLTRAEVEKVAAGMAVEETTHFFAGAILKYTLEPSNVKEPRAEFIDHHIFIRMPLSVSLDWAKSETVAIKHMAPTANSLNPKLSILIEKDFACLKTRENENEDESELFENPNVAHGTCK